jgi:dsDNA-specific endonuclease/ATPase MutS2
MIMCIQTTSNTALEFDTILQMLADVAVCEAAKPRCLALTPAQTQQDAQRRMEETTQARRIMEQTGSPPLAVMLDLHKQLDLIALSALLLPDQIAQIATFLATCRRMKSYLKKAEVSGADIALYGGSIVDLTGLEEEIGRCIRGGQVDDRATPRLAGLRRSIIGMGEQIKGKLDTLLRKNRTWFSESFVSIRGGRYTLPVKREHKGDVSGTLVDVSGSGGTCFIEPMSVRKLHDALHELHIEEDAEVRRILYELTAHIGEHMPSIRINIEAMETLDFLFAKAKLSLAMQAAPVRITERRELRILAARHPLLDRDVAVPLDFALGGDVLGIVVTGPNTGGKTVALKTVGLLSLMAQSGLHVPADERSSFCTQRAVLCDIGDGQSITENLSTFSSHITRILAILREADAQSLALLDELGSGTDPAEGMGIAVAILEELRSIGCFFAATTHYPEIKEYAARTPGLINARMAFDRQTLRPLYRLEIGAAGQSCALYIAERLGMPPNMLAQARKAAYGTQSAAGSLPQSEEPAQHIQTVRPPEPEPEAEPKAPPRSMRFAVGDSVTVYPQRMIGIVYAQANGRGEVGVQVHGKKLLVNHKRLQLKVAAAQLYPEDYDLSIVLDSVANRKARHILDKRYDANAVVTHRDGKE